MAESEQIRSGRRELGRQLARYRRAAGLTQHQLAPRTHYDRSTIANVETGRQSVPRSFWQKCDDILAAKGALLHSFDQFQALAARSRWEAAQRDLVAASATEFAAPNAEATNDPLSALTQLVRGDLVAVAELHQRIRAITAAYDSVPSVSLLASAGECLAHVAGLRTRAATGLARRDLYRVEAEASILVGKLTWDATQRCDQTTPVAHFDHAAAVAHEIGDVVTEAHALLRKGYVALYGLHQPDAGLTLATQAAELSRRASPTLSSLAILHVAEAYAMRADQRRCEGSFCQAKDSFDRRNDLDPAFDFLTPEEFSRMAGSYYLSLGMPRIAQTHLERLTKDTTDVAKVGTLVLGNLSLAYLRQRKLEEAIAMLHATLDAARHTRAGGGLSLLSTAIRELQPWRHEQSVQELYDRALFAT